MIPIIEQKVMVKDYVTKSNLPASDYVINPYIGCPHACKYCYACFMKRFTGHTEEWGTFIDIKECTKPIQVEKLKGKSIFFSSVTDCYNRFEEKYGITRKILEQLVNADCDITISTKSNLIVRDLELLKQFGRLKVAFSVNTLEEQFRSDMDQASIITERLEALKTLHHAGIHTVLFMSPIFPYITDYKQIIEKTRNFVNEYWFENLNLRGSYKAVILKYITLNYPHLEEAYREIYVKGEKGYWNRLALEMEEYCRQNQIVSTNYFYHEQLVKNKNSHVRL